MFETCLTIQKVGNTPLYAILESWIIMNTKLNSLPSRCKRPFVFRMASCNQDSE